MLRVNEFSYTACRQPWHAHAETTVTMVLAGRLRERVGGREEIAGPLSIVVKPRGTEHANEFGGGVRTIQIALPESVAASLELGAAGFRSWGWVHAGPAVPVFLRLLRARRAGNESDAMDCLVHDALAAVAAAPDAAATGEPPRWLAAVREALDDGVDASVRQLATSAGVHPVYLARQFRRFFGTSVTEYRGRGRLERAAASIAGSDRRLSFIAHDAGFADHAHMCRMFTRATGMSPGTYRALIGR